MDGSSDTQEKNIYHVVCSQEEIPEDKRLFIEIENKPIVVVNLAGDLYALGDVCTHDDGPVGDGEIEDGCIICPRHGAKFDLRSGKALSLPAMEDIPSYPVRINSGNIEIGFPQGKR